MAKRTPNTPPAECWHVFDGRLIRIDPSGDVEFLTDKPCPDFEVDPRPVPNPRAYIAASRATIAAMIAAEESPVDLRCEGSPDVDAAIPSLARLLVAMARRPEGGA